MNMIDAPTLLTIIFVLVDDWYQQHGHKFVPSMPGPQPAFSESEMLTLLLVMDTKPIPVVGYKRHKSHSDFVGSASYGH